jgi:hypothetical protein
MKILEKLKEWFIIWTWILFAIVVWWILYATLTWTWTEPDNLKVVPWQALTASWWNATQLDMKLLKWELDGISDYSLSEVDIGAR